MQSLGEGPADVDWGYKAWGRGPPDTDWGCRTWGRALLMEDRDSIGDVQSFLGTVQGPISEPLKCIDLL